MKVWLIQPGEPLPGDRDGGRLMRSGLLGAELVRRGHDVTWWSSAFDHTHKTARSEVDSERVLGDRYRIKLIACPPYFSNVGLRRIVNHRFIARRFAALARASSPPEVIACSYPTIELALEAVKFGAEAGVPVVLDVRDLWPDLFLDLLPRPLRGAGKFALWPYYEQAKRALRGATAITAVTRSYLDWARTLAGRSQRVDRVFPLGYQSSHDADRKQSADVLSSIGSEARVLVCFFGTLSGQFDIDTVISAASRLQDAGVFFVVCGTGERLARYRSAARNLRNVLLPGHVSHEQIVSVMRRSAIGLAPYRVCDNFNLNVPNKIYEYLSGGLPILSPLDGEVRALIESEGVGLHYSDGDPDELAQKIRELMDNPELLGTMSKAARRLFETRFRAEEINDQMAQYIEQIAREPVPAYPAS